MTCLLRRAEVVRLGDFEHVRGSDTELAVQLVLALQRMPVVFASALGLSVQGYGSREIANRLGCTPPTVRSRLVRARAWLVAHGGLHG